MKIRENNAINSTTSYIDPPVLTSHLILHWRIVMVFQQWCSICRISRYSTHSHTFFSKSIWRQRDCKAFTGLSNHI